MNQPKHALAPVFADSPTELRELLSTPPFQRTRAFVEGVLWNPIDHVDGILIGFAKVLA